MNKFLAVGRLTADPEIRYVAGGEKGSMCIAKYTLAIPRRMARSEEEQDTDFVRCVAFGKQGEFAEKYLRKGTKIVFTGRVQTGSYTDRNGEKRYTVDFVAEDQEFAESKAVAERNGAAAGGAQKAEKAPAQTTSAQAAPTQTTNDGFMAIPDGISGELPWNC